METKKTNRYESMQIMKKLSKDVKRENTEEYLKEKIYKDLPDKSEMHSSISNCSEYNENGVALQNKENSVLNLRRECIVIAMDLKEKQKQNPVKIRSD